MILEWFLSELKFLKNCSKVDNSVIRLLYEYFGVDNFVECCISVALEIVLQAYICY